MRTTNAGVSIVVVTHYTKQIHILISVYIKQVLTHATQAKHTSQTLMLSLLSDEYVFLFETSHLYPILHFSAFHFLLPADSTCIKIQIQII